MTTNTVSNPRRKNDNNQLISQTFGTIALSFVAGLNGAPVSVTATYYKSGNLVNISVPPFSCTEGTINGFSIFTSVPLAWVPYGISNTGTKQNVGSTSITSGGTSQLPVVNFSYNTGVLYLQLSLLTAPTASATVSVDGFSFTYVNST